MSGVQIKCVVSADVAAKLEKLMKLGRRSKRYAIEHAIDVAWEVVALQGVPALRPHGGPVAYSSKPGRPSAEERRSRQVLDRPCVLWPSAKGKTMLYVWRDDLLAARGDTIIPDPSGELSSTPNDYGFYDAKPLVVEGYCTPEATSIDIDVVEPRNAAIAAALEAREVDGYWTIAEGREALRLWREEHDEDEPQPGRRGHEPTADPEARLKESVRLFGEAIRAAGDEG